jgi:hydroxyacylglutathione hydrolase
MKIMLQAGGLTVFRSALFQLNCAVFKTNDFVLISDPGYLPEEIAEIRAFVEADRGDRECFLFLTHSDFDHIVGWQAFPDATVIASDALANHPRKQEIVTWVKQYDDDSYIERTTPILFPNVDIQVTHDGYERKVGEWLLVFHHAKGHNGDGLMLRLKKEDGSGPQVWIIGDYLSDIEFPFIYYSVIEYENTLQKIHAGLHTDLPLHVVPGHGTVCDGRQAMARLEQSRAYIEMIRQIALGKQHRPTFEEMMAEHDYKFPLFQRKFHEGNLALMKKELNH